MAVSIRVARSPFELEAVYQLRFSVLVDEEHKLIAERYPARLIRDAYDGGPCTFNVLLASDGLAVATFRLSSACDGAFPRDEFCDFSDFLRAHPDRVAHVGMIAVRRGYRQKQHLLTLLAFLAQLGRKNRTKWVVLAADSSVAPWLTKFGAFRIGNKLPTPSGRCFMVPLCFDVDELWRLFAPYYSGLEAFRFRDRMERAIFRRGELISNAPKSVGKAFYILKGQVRLRGNGAPQGGELVGQGELFGDLSAVGGAAPRMTAVADTEEVEVIVLRGSDFMPARTDIPTPMFLYAAS